MCLRIIDVCFTQLRLEGNKGAEEVPDMKRRAVRPKPHARHVKFEAVRYAWALRGVLDTADGVLATAVPDMKRPAVRPNPHARSCAHALVSDIQFQKGFFDIAVYYANAELLLV